MVLASPPCVAPPTCLVEARGGHCCDHETSSVAAAALTSTMSTTRGASRSPSNSSSNNNRRWVALAAALASVLVVLPSSPSTSSSSLSSQLWSASRAPLFGVDAAAVTATAPPTFSRRREGYYHGSAASAAPSNRVGSGFPSYQGRRRSAAVPRGGASAVAAASTASTVAAAVPMPSAEIVTSSYELVRSGGLAALWYALKRTFGSVGDGVHVALRESTTAKFLLSGAVAGIVSRTAVSPLEVVATSQMVRGGDKHMVQELSHLFQTEGIRGFFKGNAANCLKVAPTRGVQFFAFEALKQRLVEYKRKRTGNPAATLAPGERLIAGGFAGMLASSLVYPLEPVKTMLTMYPGKYPGIGAAFSGIFRQAGIGGLYKGLKPTLIAMFPYVGVEFMIYETSKIAVEALLARRAAANGGRPGRHDGTISVALPVVVSLGLGALAGAAAQMSAHPLDVVRKRLQVQGLNGNPVLYKNAMDCFSKVARNEGMSALYKGLGPACVATIPGTGIAYLSYEAMKRFLKLESV